MRLLTLALILAPLCAQAQSWECTFDTYCAEQRSCGPSDLTLKIRPQEGAADLKSYEIETGGRTLKARQIMDPSREAEAYVTGMEFNIIHLVSIFKNGTARYTSHTPVARAHSQNFLGTCARDF